MQLNNRQAHGFTLVELLIVVPIVLLIITSFVVVLISLTGDALANREQLVQARDTQGALDRIGQDIRLSNRFLAESRVVLSTPQGLNDDSTKFANVGTSVGTALILQSLSTDKNPIDSSRNLVFLTNSPNACNSILVTSNSPYYVNIVYFVKNNTLYRRTLMTYNPAPSPCVTPWQQPTCSVGLSNGTTCKSEDVALADGVASLNIDYYTTATSTTPVTDASSTSVTTAARDAALVTTKSLRASITLTKTVSGRDISYSGTSRVVKLNGSTLDPPTTPAITYFISAPAQVTFNWGVVPNATSYVVSYQINSGAWVNVPNGISSTSYTVTASRNDTVTISVAANNSAGTSPSSTSTATIPAWAACPLQNGWLNYGSTHAVAAFTKTTANVIVLKGLVASGATTGGTVICNLPPGYRPDYRLVFQVGVSGTTVGRVDIDTNGDVLYMAGNNGWLNLSSITFLPNNAYPWTHLAGLNGWQDYSAVNAGAPYPVMQVTKDSLNRAHIEGLAANGTNTSGTNTFTIPAGYTVSKHNIYGAGSGLFGDFQIVSSGTTQTRSGLNPGSFTSFQHVFYPSTIGGWTGATLQNGWVTFDTNYSPAEYLKSTDGIVSLRGLIKNGTTTLGTTLFTLPVGSRPLETIICNQVTSPDVFARVDVNPDGTVTVREGINSGWLSLAGCDFMSEQ